MKLHLLFLVIHSSLSAYLYFSPSTNPKSSSISLPIPTDWFPDYQKLYTIEFWFRPLHQNQIPGEYLLLKNPNDWEVRLIIPENHLKVSSTLKDYCLYDLIPNNIWSHISFSYDFYLPQFSCYLNGSLFSSSTTSAVAKYPNKLLIGYNFTGNFAELRVWVDEIRSATSIFQYFQTFYSPPFPSTLLRLFRMVQDPGKNIQDLVNSRKITISSDFKSPFLVESPESLSLCLSNQYKNGLKCETCASTCLYCKTKSQCLQTERKFLDFNRAGLSNDIISLGNCKSLFIGSIEFWFKSEKWEETSAELLKIPGFFKVFQKTFTRSLIVEDGSGKNVFSFETSLNWEHISWVYYNRSQVNIYHNREVFVKTWENTTGSVVFIGGSSASLRFQGIISDLRLWKSSRSQFEVLSNLNTLFLTIPSDMYRHIPLNDSESYIKSTDLLTTTYKDIIISLWRPLNCSQESCLFFCPFKWFLNSQLECKPCHSSCQACDGPESLNCTSCLPSDLIVFGRKACYLKCPDGLVAFNGLCLQSCPEGLFNQSSVCVNCIAPCLICSRADFCFNCQTGFAVYDGVCRRVCPSSQYRDQLDLCKACHQQCLECDGPGQSDCISCRTGKFFYKKLCLSSCPSKTYFNSALDQCLDCDSSCESCKGPKSTDCIECLKSKPFKDPNNLCWESCPNYLLSESSLCVDICPSKTFTDSSKKCLKCDESCFECYGPGKNECKSCSFFIHSGACLENCPSKTYPEAGLCKDCKSNCEVCLNSLDCIECSEDFQFKYKSTCIEKCPYNSFLIGNECFDCSSFCEGCQGRKDFCVKCREGLKVDQLTRKCVEKCYEGTWELNETCLERCPDGFFAFEKICSKCPENCEKCDEKNCNSCFSGFFSFNNTCLSFCPQSFFQSVELRECLPCFQSCSECLGPSNKNCSKCKTGKFSYQVEGFQCLDTCPDSTFQENEKCLPCMTGCETCENLEKCLKCRKNFFLVGKFCKENCDPGQIQLEDMCCEIEKVMDERISSTPVQVDIESFNSIKLSYSCLVTKGEGWVKIMQGDDEVLSVHSNAFFIEMNQVNVPINPFLLNYSMIYSISVTKNTIFSGIFPNLEAKNIGFFQTSSFELKKLVVIINNNTLALEIKKNEAIFLDSSESFDPSEKIRNSYLERHWNCLDISEIFKEYLKNPENTWKSFVFEYKNKNLPQNPCNFFDYSKTISDEKLRFLQDFSVNSVFLFTLLMKDLNRSADSSIFVRIIPETSIQVTVSNKPILKITPNKKLSFQGFSNEIMNPEDLIWEVSSSPSTLILFSPLAGSLVLTIGENSLSQGETYSISLHYNDRKVRTVDMFQFKVNEKPKPGNFFYEISGNLALIDSFTGNLAGWTDPDFPLMFSFWLINEENFIYTVVQPWNYLNSVNFQIFSGNFLVRAAIIDCLGAESEVFVNVTANYLENYEKIVSVAEGLLDIQDPGETFRLIFEFSNVLLEINQFGKSSLQIKEKISEKLEKIMEIIETFSNEDRVLAYISVINCILPLVQSETSEKILERSLNLLLGLNIQLFGIQQPVKFRDSLIEMNSTQKFLSSESFIRTGSIILVILEALQEKTANLTLIEVITSLLSDFLSCNQQLNERPQVIETNFSSFFIVKKNNLSSFPRRVLMNSISISFPEVSSNLSDYSVSGCLFSNEENIHSSLVKKTLQVSINSDLKSLTSPLIFTLELSLNDIKDFLPKNRAATLRPKCVFFNFSKNNWSDEGCTLMSSSVISDSLIRSHLDHFTLNVTCSCSHLSLFSVELVDNAENHLNFLQISKKQPFLLDFWNWKTSFPLHLLILFESAFGVLIIYAFFVDYSKNHSEIGLFIFQESGIYSKSQKVEIFLSSLDLHHQEIPENSKIALELESLSKSCILEHSRPFENVQEKPEEGKNKNFPKLHPRQRRYLQNFQRTSSLMTRKDQNLSEIKGNLREFEENLQRETQVDLFLKRFDYSKRLKNLENRQKRLKISQLKALQVKPSEFFAMVVTEDEEIVPCPQKVTEINYCKSHSAKILRNQAKTFKASVQVPYFRLFSLILQKEHKTISIFYPLHIEFTKKQVVCLLFTSIHLHLLTFQAFSLIFHSFSLFFLSFFSTFLIWPVSYLLKSLFAKRLIPKSYSLSFKRQMLINKACKEYLAGLLTFTLIITCIIGTVTLTFKYEFSDERSFFAWLFGFLWMVFLSDLFSSAGKAWLLWMANPKNFINGGSLWAKVSRWSLIEFPLLLPIDF